LPIANHNIFFLSFLLVIVTLIIMKNLASLNPNDHLFELNDVDSDGHKLIMNIVLHHSLSTLMPHIKRIDKSIPRALKCVQDGEQCWLY
jgi:hypothetical protein